MVVVVVVVVVVVAASSSNNHTEAHLLRVNLMYLHVWQIQGETRGANQSGKSSCVIS